MAAAKAVGRPSKVLEVTAGYDYLSGDPYFAVPGEGYIGLTHWDKIRGFTSLYGSQHKFYGMMEFFYVSTYFNGFSPGLQNAYAGAAVTLWGKLNLSGTYHYLATATKLENLGKTLGLAHPNCQSPHPECGHEEAVSLRSSSWARAMACWNSLETCRRAYPRLATGRLASTSLCQWQPEITLLSPDFQARAKTASAVAGLI